MNPDHPLNASENIHHHPPQTPNSPGEEPIDAEIIAETPANPATVDEAENPINLTYYPVLEEEGNPADNDDPLPLWLTQGLIVLSTPWGLGSLLLIVLTNLTLVGVQLWKLQQTPQESPSAILNQVTPSTNLSIPKSLNIARKAPNRVIVDGLSTVSNPSPSPQSSQPLTQPSVKASSPTQQVVNVNQPLSLTNAILPPSLQPQTPVNQALSTTPLKVPQPPKTPPVRSSIPVAEIPRPLPSSMTIQPSPPPMNNPAMSEDEQVRQAIQQQLKMEENNQSNLPLGFNHKTRLEMQNGLNELPSDFLPQQVKHLEQLQQREVLDSKNSPGVNTK
ncbi:hypothetical protein [Crocosphaera sp.]|uniref:hypothetical protein n=1 Tax=Crocosphaera sp. TaxID=2729996 RepID=UPI003F267A08